MLYIANICGACSEMKFFKINKIKFKVCGRNLPNARLVPCLKVMYPTLMAIQLAQGEWGHEQDSHKHDYNLLQQTQCSSCFSFLLSEKGFLINTIYRK